MDQPIKAELRSRQFNLSLTESELASIKRRAYAVGMRPVQFGRAILLDQGRKLVITREPSSNLA